MPANLFGLRADSALVNPWHTEPWPVVQFGSVRLWDAHTSWMETNPSYGTYDWTYLDLWLQHAADGGQSVLYTFGLTPSWASSNPNDRSCHTAPGSCDPPNDLNPDGSGTNQHWKDFVTALVDHNHNSTTAKITLWELWNEPFQPWEWTGTIPQMIRMVSDARAIIKNADPNAVVLSPSFMWESKTYFKWMSAYLAAGGGQYADGITVHGYVYSHGGKHPVAENLMTYLAEFKGVLKTFGLGSLPIYDTETGFGIPNKKLLADPDLQAAFVARLFLLHQANGLKSLYWYAWNDPMGQLWKADPRDHTKPGTVLKPGISYGNISDWMVGANMPSGCNVSGGTVWTCKLTRSGGYRALAVWDTAETCHSGSCETSNYQYSGTYKTYLALDGTKHTINGSKVPIGAKPILLQNR